MHSLAMKEFNCESLWLTTYLIIYNGFKQMFMTAVIEVVTHMTRALYTWRAQSAAPTT